MKVALLVVTVVAAAVLASAAAADGPVAGTTTITRCTFDPRGSVERGITECAQTIDIVRAGACWEPGFRLWSEDTIASVRSYRGNAVLPGLNGVAVSGGFDEVVRAHSVLLEDSGPHAFSTTFPVEDSTCA